MNAMDIGLEQRVAKLERSVKLWRLLGVVGLLLVVGMGATFAVQDAEFGVVKARSFQVVNAAGQIQGAFGLGANDDGSSLIAIDVNANQFIIPGPDNRPYVRLTTIASDVEGKKVGGLALTDHGRKKQTLLLAGKELTEIDSP
jgi:hypothetical protein